MNFKILKKDFLDKLSISLKAVSSLTPLPILAGVKLTLTSDELILLSSDSNISIKNIIKKENDVLEIIEEGEIIIDARFLAEMIKRVDSSFVQIETIDGNYIKIYGGGSEYKINSFNVSDYPNILFNIPETSFELDSSLFIDAVSETSFACSEKDTKPVLTGVNFKAHDNLLIVNATDSYRLAYKKIELTNPLDFDITIPCKYLSEITKCLTNNSKVKIAVDSQQVFFIFDNTIIKTRLLDDIFPDTSKLLPSEFVCNLKVDSRELLSQIDKTSIIKGDGKYTIKLHITKSLVSIFTADENGSFSGKMNVVSFDGDEYEISCSYKYLQDAVKALACDVVMISFSGELKPFIIRDEKDDKLVQLICPVRTYK